MSLRGGCGLRSDATARREPTLTKLIYTALASLDGYVADAGGSFAWAAPDAEVHGFINDRERATGTMLLGRKTYEVLSVWDTMQLTAEPEPMQDYQRIWQLADKLVYSRTLRELHAPRTRLAGEFVPDAVRALKAGAGHDLGIGGPELAAHALRAGLVDELQLFLFPVVIGAGTPALPEGLALRLELIAERRFSAGTVFLHYVVAR